MLTIVAFSYALNETTRPNDPAQLSLSYRFGVGTGSVVEYVFSMH